MVETKVGVLTIGTELTTGQIQDAHGAWLARLMTDRGYRVSLLMTVPDHREEILRALHRFEGEVSWLFIFGGLGPTSDDFTRDVLAKWLDRPLEYDQQSWDHICKRLQRFGVNVVSSQKQQCYYPSGSRVLSNVEGTANAFYLKLTDPKPHHVFVIPGPPKERDAVWRDHILALVDELSPRGEQPEMVSWKCAGRSEAELAELTEEYLRDSGFLTGYRAQFPYVEVKVWVPGGWSHLPAKHPNRLQLAGLERALSPWVISGGHQDIAHEFLSCLAQYRAHQREGSDARQIPEFVICDEDAGGVLVSRLTQCLFSDHFGKEEWDDLRRSGLVMTTHPPSPTSHGSSRALRFHLEPSVSLQKWGYRLPDGTQQSHEYPYRVEDSVAQRLRRAKLITELALHRWHQWLHSHGGG